MKKKLINKLNSKHYLKIMTTLLKLHLGQMLV